VVKYKLLIFDFDGTLADTYPWFTSIMNQVADKYRFRHVSESEYETLREFSAKQLMQHLGIPLWKTLFISSHIRRLMARDLQKISLFDGVDGLLTRLFGGGVTLAVVSSNSSHNVHSVLGPDNASLISHYECGVSVFSKTSRLKKIIRMSGKKQSETMYIGDEIRDLEAAQKAKVTFGAVSWGYNKSSSLAERSPDKLFATLQEISECAF
jgi:phosphoglycolate phosphatase